MEILPRNIDAVHVRAETYSDRRRPDLSGTIDYRAESPGLEGPRV
jgi:hypothetical protein